MTSDLDGNTRRLALRFAEELTSLSEAFVAREDTVHTIGLAVLCREHVLLIGPPGTAKTALFDRFTSMINATQFSYLLTRYTEPAELFGAIDVRSFQQDSVYRVNTAGMLPRAEIAFLDEVFHGSSAILNSLLTLINERVFHNGSEVEQAPLITLFGAANAIPEDELLLAFCDRFLFRSRLEYVPHDGVSDVLRLGWRAEQAVTRAGHRPMADAAGFSLTDLRILQAAVVEVDVEPIIDDLTKIILALRDEGVAFSDRRAVKAQKAIAAHALLAGRGRAEIEDLRVLTGLWTSPLDEDTIRTVVEVHGVPVHTPAQIIGLPDIRWEVSKIMTSSPSMGRTDLLAANRDLGHLLAQVRAHYPDAAAEQRSIGEAQARIESLLRQARNGDGDV
ncbi:AAA family ATPase [Catellatospora coxensis]|uniref:MoxR-like ATPase n=1 Tax=Catellatospora coxensis TaxID=310354 RepID=A0A8J3KY96_9ACTN|nr:AAA family ATPase [Catellatospora coxensis]GIG10928.1 hypothetical protein Cco03nite_76280 [Catellatospora coxensis]